MNHYKFAMLQNETENCPVFQRHLLMVCPICENACNKTHAVAKANSLKTPKMRRKNLVINKCIELVIGKKNLQK